MAAALPEYLWMCIVGGFFGFVYAFGIGANDVANAFASTVASGSLTLKQAVIVASIFEFCGAFFLGSTVTNTIRSKIFSTKLYANEPEVVMLGMMTSLVVASFMLLLATSWGLPVSTTHTIVGTIMGFSICAKGFDSINWTVAKQIFISWAVSPLVSGALAFFFFVFVKFAIMKSEHAFDRAVLLFPVVLTCGIGIDLFFILFKGISNKKKLELKVAIPISFGVGAFFGLIWLLFVGPCVKRRIYAKMAEEEANVDAVDVEDGEAKVIDDPTKEGEEVDQVDVDGEVDIPKPAEAVVDGDAVVRKSLSQRFADATYGQDLRAQSYHENKRSEQLWDNSENYDIHAEELFTYVQVLTACLNSFAHGANDVANAIAPISAIVYIYQTGALNSKSPVQKWILAYGGIGIVAGLLLYGYIIMKTLGYKMTPLSPSRGSCAELAASLFVVTASFLGIPVSSTQSIVGAVAGVGLVNGLKNLQWLVLLRICLGWVGIFFSSVLLSAGLFSFVAFSPTLVN